MDRARPASPLNAPPRLFSRTLPGVGAELELAPEEAQHARVLRLAAGDEVCLFDGLGRSVRTEIIALAKGVLCCAAKEPIIEAPRPARVVLVQCLPKAGKLDDIVRMTTELGVAEIALALSEHCVARDSAASAAHKLERLQRIAIAAAAQAEQPYLPDIVAPMPLEEVLARAPDGAYRAACVERTATPLPRELNAEELWLVVGPEGGLSAADRAMLQEAKFVPTALGRSILRTETAAVVGVALALERFGRCR